MVEQKNGVLDPRIIIYIAELLTSGLSHVEQMKYVW